MRFIIFTHSIVSDWNHGNAHFLRGLGLELLSRGHDVTFFEPEKGWSRTNLLQSEGLKATEDFHTQFPGLQSELYNASSIDLQSVLKNVDVVLVHEWNEPELIAAVGRRRSRQEFILFFHDTHHRVVSDIDGVAECDLRHYDAVLAYGNVIRDSYLAKDGVRAAFTWHEAADVRTFKPAGREVNKRGDLVWIGNWGDGEREESLREFLIRPVKELGLTACVYGVRYPKLAVEELADAGITFGGWLPNYKVPEVFSAFRATVHIPRSPYVRALPGIPTIRPFEALACGIPLVSAPWSDTEHLFMPGKDFLFAQNGREMTLQLERVLSNRAIANELSEHGLATIRQRHTCGHRVDELLSLVEASAAVQMAGGGG